jgi:hypothetical protein
VTGVRLTPAEAARRLKSTLVEEIRRQTGNGIKRGMTVAARYARRDYRSEGLGRALWAKKATRPGIPRLLVSVARVVDQGDRWATGLKVSGMAAVIEKGGRVQPHKIKGSWGKPLVFVGKSGTKVFPNVVQHPGCPVPARPALDRALESASGALREQVDRGLKRAAEVFG